MLSICPGARGALPLHHCHPTPLSEELFSSGNAWHLGRGRGVSRTTTPPPSRGRRSYRVSPGANVYTCSLPPV